MQIPTDHITLLQSLGAYSFASTTPSEIASKLQTVPGSAVDKIFTSIEMLYAFREQIGADGETCLAQLAGFGLANHWDFPGQPGRMQAIYDSAMGALGQTTLAPDFQQPAPVIGYRIDGFDWREHVLPDIARLKAGRKAAVTALKEEKENLPAPTPFGLVDNDDGSKVRLNGAVTMAMVAEANKSAYSIDWTMHDNSTLTCDAAKITTLGVAAGQHVANVHAYAQTLKTQIDAVTVDTAATDQTAALKAAADAINAIDITAGWPA